MGTKAEKNISSKPVPEVSCGVQWRKKYVCTVVCSTVGMPSMGTSLNTACHECRACNIIEGVGRQLLTQN